MATTSQTIQKTSDPSTTQLNKRDVASEIRYLAPANNLLKLVSSGEIQKGKMSISQKGLMSKRRTTEPRVEGYYSDPIDLYLAAQSVNGLAVTFADATTCFAKQVWQNTANNHVGCISTVSTNTCTFVAITSSFTVAAGDVLQYLGTAYEEGSYNRTIIGKTDDNYYNVLQWFSFPVEFSVDQTISQQLAGGDLMARKKRENFCYAMRAIERSFLFGERATSGNTTTVGSDSIATMRGLWNMAQTSFDCGNALTPSMFRNDLYTAMHESVNSANRIILLMSKWGVAMLNEWANDKMVLSEKSDSPDLAQFGWRSKKFTCGSFDVEVSECDAFNEGENKNKALFVVPEDVEYIYLAGWDLQVKENQQANDKLSKKDDFLGKLSCLTKDGGYSLMKVENIGIN